ncbi:MAG: TonB-dependent receptor [Bacteroidetes bacterium 4572_77]|nr:MAG: TonB-dependent receptor [Bacteroidetes bacterium 4572_77]
MRRMIQKMTLIAVMALFSSSLFAQGTVTGRVMDPVAEEGLIQATVIVSGTSYGTTTDMDGKFILNAPEGEQTINVQYVGFKSYSKQIVVIKGETVALGNIPMESSQIGLAEINVLANIAVDRKTPVAVSTIKAAEIEEVLGSQELPEVLNRTPGVYATKGAGGYGDSKITIRGFDQRNVAVMINGIPVNDMENGWVYWSNWAGLGDAVSSMQVQRGLGASKLAINSVGGTMNVLTKTTEADKGGSIVSSMTSYGNKKVMVGLNTGVTKSGLAVTFVGSRTEGPGYIDATYVDAWSYYLSVSKNFGKKHKLQFTVIGAPQEHGQRDGSQYSAQTYDHMEKWGTRYNPNWGFIGGGEMLNERNNFYHKPQTALNWYWQINEKNFLATSAYVSTGNGGGSGILGVGSLKYGAPQNALGQRDWDYAVAVNDTSSTGSHLIMRNSMNNHFWAGALSSLNSELTENITLTAGIDARYYKGEHYREVRDLLGGTHWDDQVNHNAQVGDRIAYDNDGLVQYGGVFAQLEGTFGNLNAFVAATASNTWYGRTDRYNFARGNMDTPDAETVTAFGYNAKAGANYNVSESSNIYVNAGYYSRAPFHNYVYINYGNDINPNLANEKIMAAELGYGLNLNKFTLRVNAYYTNWTDKWSIGYIRFTDEAGEEHNGTVYFQGLNENHTGIELEAKAKLTKNFELGGFVSYGDWK